MSTRYGDVVASGGVTHQHPLSDTFQHGAKRAYYAAITNVDTQVIPLNPLCLVSNFLSDRSDLLEAAHNFVRFCRSHWSVALAAFRLGCCCRRRGDLGWQMTRWLC